VRLGIDLYEPLARAGIVSSADLAAARELSRLGEGSTVAILTSRFCANPEAVNRYLAAEAELATVDAETVPLPSAEALARVDRRQAIRHQFAACGLTGESGGVVVVLSDPFDADLLQAVRAGVKGPVDIVMAAPAGVSRLLERSYGAETVRRAVHALADRAPLDSAATVVTPGQKMLIGALTPAVALFAFGATLATTLVVNFLTLVLYAAAAIFRMRLIGLATDPGRRDRADGAPAREGEHQLPLYTILVPMYHEAAVVPTLIRSLGRLDYPAHRLDVLLICEEDDEETVAAIEKLALGSQFRLLRVPDALPKTKPKACNYALEFARGEMVVIFDAEDRPEPDQLRKAIAVFDRAGPELACVQARLDYWNVDTNLLTRWFTIEYAMWFGLILPGLEQIDAPVPLGGTSNHFRIEVLEALGGWDPYNVTEDADLGVRLHKRGYRTLNLDSTTLEEANAQLGNWIRQRSRWVKGHLQTWLVHNRNPRRTVAELGLRPYLAFQLLIGMGVLGALLNPLYWAIILVWAATRSGIIAQEFPPVLDYLAALNLLTWNFAFVYVAAVGVARKRSWKLVLYAFTTPIYWALISWAAWKGVLQLIRRPFFWEKTDHGLVEDDLSAAPAARPAALLGR
jgi:cellulose synthase/poly-beta-1,6-N-acetylglucosamine synthase-like glycosyltransferase